jgi:hypothetical protein
MTIEFHASVEIALSALLFSWFHHPGALLQASGDCRAVGADRGRETPLSQF